MDLPSEDICVEICKRSILISAFVRPLAEGATQEEMVKNADRELIRPYAEKNDKLMCKYEVLNRSMAMEQRVEAIN